MSATRFARSIAFTFALCLVAAGIAAAQAPGQKAEKKPEPTITLATKPTPAAAGETTLTVTAKDAAGKPIIGADVSVEFVMPPMGGMAEMKNTIALKPSTDPKPEIEEWHGPADSITESATDSQGSYLYDPGGDSPVER